MDSTTDNLKRELAIAHKTISAFQKTFRKSFPSPHLCYHIKAPAENGKYGYLCANYNGFYLSSSMGDNPAKRLFKFEEDSDGAFSIYSMSETKFLQIQTSSWNPSALSVMFCAKGDHKSKFALIFYPQQDQHQLGILVDIYSLANRCFLSLSANVNLQNQLVASPTAPANKFLILAEDMA